MSTTVNSTQPRIAPVEPPYAAEVLQSFAVVMPDGMEPLNIFRTMAHNPRVLSRMVRGGLLDRGSISMAQRELVILRACALCHAEYEWGVHVSIFGAKAGFTEAQIADTVRPAPDATLWAEEQLAILALVDELHSGASVSDATWARVRTHFGEDQVIELVMLAGLYHAVSFVVNAFRVAGEPWAARFA